MRAAPINALFCYSLQRDSEQALYQSRKNQMGIRLMQLTACQYKRINSNKGHLMFEFYGHVVEIHMIFAEIVQRELDSMSIRKDGWNFW